MKLTASALGGGEGVGGREGGNTFAELVELGLYFAEPSCSLLSGGRNEIASVFTLEFQEVSSRFLLPVHLGEGGGGAGRGNTIAGFSAFHCNNNNNNNDFISIALFHVKHAQLR